jgi:hypothetical protein
VGLILLPLLVRSLVFSQFTEINLETGTGLALLTPTDSTCLYDLTNLKWLLPPTYPANSQPIVSMPLSLVWSFTCSSCHCLACFELARF